MGWYLSIWIRDQFEIKAEKAFIVIALNVGMDIFGFTF